MPDQTKRFTVPPHPDDSDIECNRLAAIRRFDVLDTWRECDRCAGEPTPVQALIYISAPKRFYAQLKVPLIRTTPVIAWLLSPRGKAAALARAAFLPWF